METIEIIDDAQNTNTKIRQDDPWYIYTSWNQFIQPTEFVFVAANSKKSSKKNDIDPRQDLTLIGKLEMKTRDYSVLFLIVISYRL